MNYDYIIIGAGSSGCVVANRLTKNNHINVLLIEAGNCDSKPEIKIPGSYQCLAGTDIDWCYRTEKEPFLANRRIDVTRGKVLGGCSSINAMIYICGNKVDYDSWAALGNLGWSYEELSPLFENIEKDQAPAIHVDTPHLLSQYFIEASLELGYTRNFNFNGDSQWGAGFYQATIKNGLRFSAVDAFLRPIYSRKNFFLEVNACVLRIIIENKRAVGIVYRKDDKEFIVKVNKEIILCAGTFNSPQLLMLSGIGSAKILTRLGIPVVADLPGVGENLQDHIWTAITYTTNTASPAATSNGCEVGLFTRSNVNRVVPDMQMDAGLNLLFSPINNLHGATFSLCPILLHPKSRGKLSLKSADPLVAPVIQANYLQCEEDIYPLIAGVHLARKLGCASSFKGLLNEEIFPGNKVVTDLEIRNFIYHSATTLWHPVGTCRMGIDSDCVVDPTLKVYGVIGLRVVDASIMPTITSGNTHAPCLLIGEKGAKIISEESYTSMALP